jgi:phosphohistidine phosphatase
MFTIAYRMQIYNLIFPENKRRNIFLHFSSVMVPECMLLLSLNIYFFMKTIYIVRHAKSSWNMIDIPDEQRPLLEKGRKRTMKVIGYLLENNIKVDHILSSHAVRAFETAKMLADGLKFPVENIMVDSHIYHADGDKILDRFYDLPEGLNSVMLVGHNPSLTDFVNIFLKSPIENLPTSGVVSFSFETDNWEKLPAAGHKTNFILFPKEMPGTED